MITTDGDIRVTSKEAAIVGFKGCELSATVNGSNLAVISMNTPEVVDTEEGLLVDGDQEHSVNADDYLVSQKDLYGEFLNDGLMIHYDCDAEFDLEIAAIWQR
jgi:hypothetical protein